MKKQVIPVFSFLLLLFMGGALPCSSLKAQDFLVTIQRDTLNCKIGKMEGDFYPIEFKWDDELMQGTIHKDSILYFKRNMFRSMDDNRLRPWYPVVHLSLNLGGGRQFGPLRVGLTENNTPKKGDRFRSGNLLRGRRFGGLPERAHGIRDKISLPPHAGRRHPTELRGTDDLATLLG